MKVLLLPRIPSLTPSNVVFLPMTTISWNIAYDTLGHCYMTEDGIEKDNLLDYNLGASTHMMLDDGILSIAESDMFASTFLISSPTNMFLNNVATGSEDTGTKCLN